MKIYLMIKTHRVTGLKYLCKTTRDPYKYHGSGVYWKRHLRVHGKDVDTTILRECSSHEEVKEWGVYYSLLWNVVNDIDSTGKKTWANQRIEEGDGGDTSQFIDYSTWSGKFSGQNNPMFGKKRNIPQTQLDNAHLAAKLANRCPVVMFGVTYASISEAEKANPGISVRKRIDNPRHLDCYRLRERTKRK